MPLGGWPVGRQRMLHMRGAPPSSGPFFRPLFPGPQEPGRELALSYFQKEKYSTTTRRLIIMSSCPLSGGLDGAGLRNFVGPVYVTHIFRVMIICRS